VRAGSRVLLDLEKCREDGKRVSWCPLPGRENPPLLMRFGGNSKREIHKVSLTSPTAGLEVPRQPKLKEKTKEEEMESLSSCRVVANGCQKRTQK
jgi:hypothetical protein